MQEKVRIVTELRRSHGKLKLVLQIAGLPKSTYYDYVNGNHKEEDQKLLDLILKIWLENKKNYGYRRITVALNNMNYRINHKRVSRLMKLIGIQGEIRRKKYSSYQGELGKIAGNELNRDFKPDTFGEKLVTDITEFNVAGRKVYLSPLIDLFNKEVLSYSISFTPNTKMVVEMLKQAKNHYKRDTMIHSDQGAQYQSLGYQKYLKERNITLSMSRRGNCYDNSLAENFFSHVKCEFFYKSRFKTVEEFITGLRNYIKYYNEKRIVTKLKMSPVQYREHCLI